jgi:hypothetical protein
LRTGRINITKNTYSIHHFAASWQHKSIQFYNRIRDRSVKIFGYHLGKIFVIPVLIIAIVSSEGLNGLFKAFKLKFKTNII